MVLTHLRRNAVAYLALVVALSTGSAYAAAELPEKLPKHSVGAKQLKKNAVTSKSVKNGSLRASDLAAGVLPAGTEIEVRSFGGTPAPAPDLAQFVLASFATTVTGRALVRFDLLAGANCSAGGAFVSMWIDGVAVPGTSTPTLSNANLAAVVLQGVVQLPAGAHRAEVRLDCPAGTPGLFTVVSNGFSAIVTPG
jgi:hypothetical protein